MVCRLWIELVIIVQGQVAKGQGDPKVLRKETAIKKQQHARSHPTDLHPATV